MAEEFPVSGGGATADSGDATGQRGGSRVGHLRTVSRGGGRSPRPLAADSSRARPVAGRGPRILVQLGGATTRHGPAGNPGASAWRAAGARGALGGAFCLGHLATTESEKGAG